MELEAFDSTPAVVKWFNSGQRLRRPNFAYRMWPDELIAVADSWESPDFVPWLPDMLSFIAPGSTVLSGTFPKLIYC